MLYTPSGSQVFQAHILDMKENIIKFWSSKFMLKLF
jgi:hypothetical protein